MEEKDFNFTWKDAAVIIGWHAFVIAICFWAGWAFAPSQEEIVSEIAAQEEPVFLTTQEISSLQGFCITVGWDSYPVYENEGWDGTLNSREVIGVRCKSMTSQY